MCRDDMPIIPWKYPGNGKPELGFCSDCIFDSPRIPGIMKTFFQESGNRRATNIPQYFKKNLY